MRRDSSDLCTNGERQTRGARVVPVGLALVGASDARLSDRRSRQRSRGHRRGAEMLRAMVTSSDREQRGREDAGRDEARHHRARERERRSLAVHSYEQRYDDTANGPREQGVLSLHLTLSRTKLSPLALCQAARTSKGPGHRCPGPSMHSMT